MKKLLFTTVLILLFVGLTQAEDWPVKITQELAYLDVVHNGQTVRIQRKQSASSTVNPDYAKTSRPCPPFCIQPIKLSENVETVGELEVINYLREVSAGNKSILVIDSRTPDWVSKGSIPGSVNIPWTKLKPDAGADPFTISDILQNQFGVISLEGLWDFTNAKTLVLFCNGMWCGQSPSNIQTLLSYGYPANKLKWYRGGMQDWENLGLTIVK